MNIIKQQLALEQIEYRKPISIANQFMDFVMQMRPQAPIRITPNYPIGWTAEAPAEDKVWTIECIKGEIRLTKVADLCGHTPNYHYIKLAEEDIREYEEIFLQEMFCDPGEQMLPLTCDVFCNPDESWCKYCSTQGGLRDDKKDV